ncbi:MAG: hypothetical protein ACRCTZ_08650 [Sarcina sp.]
MEIFYPEDFNALFGRGDTENLPEKVENDDSDITHEDVDTDVDYLDSSSKKKFKNTNTAKEDLEEDLSRTCPCEGVQDIEVSETKKPMELPPKATPPKTDESVINQKKIDNSNYPKYAVSPKALSVCLNKLTYIWQNDKKEYWCYIFYVDQVSFVGWRWNKYIKDWVYFGIDISKVEAFTCKK